MIIQGLWANIPQSCIGVLTKTALNSAYVGLTLVWLLVFV
ncbi:hypothetical protein HBZC1_01390 [Helicobacter bizzozeronii CIII-1]|uniref:Uncharacterized protein n=1 Tax=Helicobacter bizzozeronii (strain CIII-1) TaxID=1002804 RepID=F8KPY8_HELBC|nr:hypothetical protein HBZC1_01390 [Helicobacter bizzozeronii CIII-1]CCF81073.1 hypothetical protein HBZS_115220 [Helicobacter bizzozeronii CCUG 35545]